MPRLKNGANLSFFLLLFFIEVAFASENGPTPCLSKDPAEKFLCDFNRQVQVLDQKKAYANWKFETNTTDDSELQNASTAHSDFMVKKRLEARQLNTSHLPYFERRQFKRLRQTASSNNHSIRTEILRLSTKIMGIYSTAKVCLSNGTCLLQGESGITHFFKYCKDPTLLAEAWKKWRDQTGRLMRSDWLRMMELENFGARKNHFNDIGEAERIFDYEIDNLQGLVRGLFNQLSPLYRQLHGYVRYKLRQRYPSLVNPLEPLPVHLFGNTWGQEWSNIYSMLVPYPDAPKVDATKEMQKKNWTINKMVHKADNLFQSLGFERMTKKFWNYSIFVKPKDRPIECHASAFDFGTDDDFRIKMCAEVHVNQVDLETIHHEMGHIVYYMAYRHQPPLFRTGANPAFHEAVGDTAGLLVGTRSYLSKLGLFKQEGSSDDENAKMNINNQMLAALKKIAFLPFALSMDEWRWGAYDGSIQPSDWTAAWWKLRLELQGVVPPVPRSSSDFDPGAKYHVAIDSSYIRYFLSFIIQFQFFEAMCKEAGFPDTKPLHLCDFSGSRAAGRRLKNMLELGTSKHWIYAMEAITGQQHVKTDAILRYFEPLHKWLTQYNCEHGVPIGWNGENELSC